MGLGQEVLRKDKWALLDDDQTSQTVTLWCGFSSPMTVVFLVTDLLFVFLSDQIIKYTVEHLV